MIPFFYRFLASSFGVYKKNNINRVAIEPNNKPIII